MPSCHEMRKGEIYVCEDCGLELQVIKECEDSGTPVEDCGCEPCSNVAEFSCCGKPLVEKAA